MKMFKLEKLVFTVVFISIFSFLGGEPPREIPEHLLNAFTLNGTIPVSSMYFDNSYGSGYKITVFKYDQVESYKEKILNRKCNYYGLTDLYLYEAIEKYCGTFNGKTVGIIGSVTPWYEAITLVYEGKPITVEYNKIECNHPDIKTLTVEEYRKNPIQFDYLISISSIEHDGLGRYGDPINPTGDLKAMNEAREMLKEGGYFFLAVPVGKDWLTWNAHRVYGSIRLKMLLDKWKVIGSVGYNERDLEIDNSLGYHQPVFILTK